MVVIRAGIDVAVHCKESLLHAAAFSKFRSVHPWPFGAGEDV